MEPSFVGSNPTTPAMLKLIKSSIKSAGSGIRNDPEVRKIINRFPRFFNFLKKRLTPDEIFGLHLTIGIIIVGIFVYLFFNILLGLFTQDILVLSDLRVLNIIKTFRSPGLNKFMLFVTTLGSGAIIFTGTVALATFFYLAGRWRYAISILVSVVFGEVFYRSFKYMVERSRPPQSLAIIKADGYSFPSGHAFMAVAFYGLIAYFIWRFFSKKPLGKRHGAYLKRTKKIITIVFFVLFIGNIGLSRIYLGVHWPSDVLAGFTAGFAWIAAFITALEIRKKYNKKKKETKRKIIFPINRVNYLYNNKKLRITGTVFLILWVLFVVYFWKREAATVFISNSFYYGNISKIIVLDDSNLPNKIFDNLPRVSETISGKPQEPINIIIFGSEEKLKATFSKAGWFECERINLKSLKKMAVASILNKPYPNAPGVPSLWDSLPNDFAFEKPTEANSARERHHIHFWETPYKTEEGQNIWVATAHYDTTIKMKTAIVPVHTIDPAIDKERDQIRQELNETGEVKSFGEFQITDPILGKNQSGDAFFTDGKAIILYLK